MRVLLSGATGFLGSHIAELLFNKDYVLALTCRKQSNKWRCDSFANSVIWIDTDVEGWGAQVIEFAPEVIINCAWDGVGVDGRGDWVRQIQNIVYQQKLLDIAVTCGCHRFVGMGSQAEYGLFSGTICEDAHANPNSAYGATKLAAQVVLKSFCENNHIAWYWFRLFSGFGEKEGDGWLVPSTIRNMLKGNSMDFTPGEQKYSYLYIGEVAQTIAAAIITAADSGVYNISSSRVISIKDLLIKIQQQVNPDCHLNFGALPYRDGQVMSMEGDSQKLRDSIYTPRDDQFDQKLTQTIKYYIKQYE